MGEKEEIVRAYNAMVISRTFDKRIMMAQRQGKVGFYTPTMGQEAIQIGLSMCLTDDDIFFQYYRDVPLMIHRGVPVEKLMDQIIGNKEDEEKGRQMPSHFSAVDYHFMSVQSPVATNLPLAVGYAYKKKYRNEKGIVTASFGDGSSSEPDFHAAMNMAAVWNVPVLFFCENNGWAISIPTEKQTKQEIWKKADAYGMKGYRIEGRDLLEMYEQTKPIVDMMRETSEPVLIEAVCYRMGPHSTSDDPTKYRKNEITEGSPNDPIVLTEKKLIERGYIDQAHIEKIKKEANELIEKKLEERLLIPEPSDDTLFQDIYENKNWILEEEERDLQ
ncbi:thiamine pyrophosphate-dependent dehydrogenase E1 component subunit alpha [Caldiplasma sukawensis]